MKHPPSEVQIYLLRLWPDKIGRSWQIMLKCAATDKRHVFRDLQQLTDFLQKQIERNQNDTN